MINRRRALIGYLTYFFTTRIAGRIVRKKAGDLGPGSSDNGGTGMLNRTKSAPQAMAARTAMLVAAARPIVERAWSFASRQRPDKFKKAKQRHERLGRC